MNRALHVCGVMLLLGCGVVGCGTGGKGYAECELASLSAMNSQLLSTEFGTKKGPDGKPVTDPTTTGKYTVVHLLAGAPAYYGLIRSTYDASDPINKMQAQNVTANTQSSYPFLNLSDGTTYVTGDKPATQTEHIAAGSESTTFIVEVDHNREPTDEKKWVHRIYVLEVTDHTHICVWAQESMNYQKPKSGTPVKENEFVESRYKEGRWVLSSPQLFTDPSNADRQNAVNATKAILSSAGF